MLEIHPTANMGGPWLTDLAYLRDAFSVLHAQVKRLHCERVLRDLIQKPKPLNQNIGPQWSVSEGEAKRRLENLVCRERTLRAEVNAALERHKSEAESIRLGMDVLTEKAGLDEVEREVLLCLAAPALSTDLATFLYGDLDHSLFGGGLTIEALVELCSPPNFEDYVAARFKFRQEAALVRHGFISIDHFSRHINPEEELAAQVRLTWVAFGTLIGQPDLRPSTGREE